TITFCIFVSPDSRKATPERSLEIISGGEASIQKYGCHVLNFKLSCPLYIFLERNGHLTTPLTFPPPTEWRGHIFIKKNANKNNIYFFIL
ncbi:hypothetical protein, partial [Sodalis sp.]|uniref:hypothetical protein n=1 Tax=Sodalis sp. (in: enterobacteria) TaxID=1898979 RepID=UPI00387368BD